ncbi:hypothetical protein [Halorientalis marina]|uniref:hypothetical protein n=1 Tax=Halorientalis marina TaxID=2931976 RepID=UPI001FF18229|nr:hypothetical protein [Halorientalis marina]
MSGEGPPPIVPSMETTDEPPEQSTLVRPDGGSHPDREAPADRPFGAPLVPDCS